MSTSRLVRTIESYVARTNRRCKKYWLWRFARSESHSTWLIARFNGFSRMMKTDNTRRFVRTVDDIHDVLLLLRSTEKNLVVYKKNERQDVVRDFIRKVGISENASIASLKELLVSRFKEGGEDFKKLFIFYSMSTFLTPTANYKIDFSCMLSLMDVDAIPEYDWCSYILERLCKVAIKIFVPIHLRLHFFCAVMNFLEDKIQYLDNKKYDDPNYFIGAVHVGV